MNSRHDGALDLDLHFASVPRDDSAGLATDHGPDTSAALAALGSLLLIAAMVYGALLAVNWLDSLLRTPVIS